MHCELYYVLGLSSAQLDTRSLASYNNADFDWQIGWILTRANINYWYIGINIDPISWMWC